MRINDTMLREVCGLITERLISQIETALGCSHLEAAERFKASLTDLFPADAPAPKKKPRRRQLCHGTPLNRAAFPAALIKTHFYEIDGHVFRKVAMAGRAIGSEAGSTASLRRPCSVPFMGYRFPRAHIVFVLRHGRWPSRPIFHKNFDRSDDRISNLVEATQSEICTSAQVTSRNRFGVKGVRWPKLRTKAGPERYEASIQRAGIVHRLGTFDTPEQAHRAYCAAAAAMHGNFNPSSRLYSDT